MRCCAMEAYGPRSSKDHGGKVNKRARQRLIGVTALLFVAIAAIVVGTTSSGAGSGAVNSTVSEVLADETLVGEKVKVGGIVV